jgi:hypothetical protein
MAISNEIETTCRELKEKLDNLEYGSVEIVIINGKIDRVEIRDSIKIKN